VAKAFGVPLVAIKRTTKLYRERGPAGFFVSATCYFGDRTLAAPNQVIVSLWPGCLSFRMASNSGCRISRVGLGREGACRGRTGIDEKKISTRGVVDQLVPVRTKRYIRNSDALT